MKTTVLRKDELIEMLMEMDSKLEQLNCSLVSNISNQKQLWEAEQELRLNSCVRQLDSLERKMTSNRERNGHNSASIRLKLSY